MQVLIWFGHPSIFVDAGEILVMADDVAAPSNPLAALVKQEELEKMLLNMNVFQQPREEEPYRRVVRIRVDRSTWDRRLFFNPHALTIYLEFFPTQGAAP
jgi:hypothetical protein